MDRHGMDQEQDSASLPPTPIEELHNAIERYLAARAEMVGRPVPLMGDWAVSIEAIIDDPCADDGGLLNRMATITVIRETTPAASAKRLLASSTMAMHEHQRRQEQAEGEQP